MKTNKLFNLVAAMLLSAVAATAQDVNRLYLGEMVGMKSSSLDMPVYLDNTSPGIVAFQFDLKVPDGVTVSQSSSANKPDGIRAVDHRVNVRKLSDGTYRVIMLSPTNRPFRANKGALATIMATIADSAPLEENQSYPLTLSNVVLSDSLGNNVLTAFGGGALRIGANPDFIITDVKLQGVTTVSPMDSVAISWSVQNQGGADAEGGFREQVYLVSSVTGEEISLGSVYHNNELLASGSSATFTHKFRVPRIVGIDGKFEVLVKLVPDKDSGESKEYQANNTRTSNGAYSMNKMLYFTERASVSEGDIQYRQSYSVERSGSRVEIMTFPVSLAGGDSRLSLSASEVVIKKGNSTGYVYLNVAGNTTLEGDVAFCMSVPAANGYQAVESPGMLIDDELPAIDISASKSMMDEGETVSFTLTVTSARSEDLKVKLTSESPSLFKAPISVVVPAGETSVTFDVTAVDDDIVNEASSVVFTAYSEGYIKDECCVLVYDNDMPQLTMSLTPTTVSESAGPTAIMGVITRDKTNSEITIRLSDNSTDGDLYYSTKKIRLGKGQDRAEFSIGVVDNQMVDGDRDIEIVAGIYISSCNCLAGQASGGYLTQKISIVDNDGPALALTSKSGNILEGSENNTLTLSRNDSPDNDLTVQITSTGEGLTFPGTVTMPAGSRSVDVNVALARNDVSDDSRVITFKAAAAGYANGTCWVMSTDQTLPDAMITSLRIVTNNVYAGDEVVVETEIYNGGYAEFPKNTPLLFKHGDNSEKMYLRKAVEPGESFVQLDTIVSKRVAGSYYLQVSCDYENTVKEINEANNLSERCTLVLAPLFKATANVDKERYLNSDTVYITGHVEGLYSRNAEVEVYVKSSSIRNSIITRTDDNGDYKAMWVPVGNQAGHFIVGASTVGENLNEEMDAFDVYGMRRYDSGFILNELEAGEVEGNYLHLQNHGSLPLTGLKVTAEYNTRSARIDFEGVTELQPGMEGKIAYTIEGLTPSGGDDWEKIYIRIESAEGASFEQTAYYYVHSSKPVLKAGVKEINTTIIKGETRDYEIFITNQGRGETGAITVDLGNVGWLRTATPVRMASMAQGDSAVIVLQMTPMAQAELNSIYKGNFVISCENGSSANIHYYLEVVSESTGTLVVDVQDEFTVNTAEAPHVEGATVNVLHPVTQKLLRQYVTGADGLATFHDMPEGRYIVKVTHPKHSSKTMDVIVDPERTSKYVAFIEYSAITIEMTYERTEIEDEYNIVTTVKYETNVPKPVVVMDVPDRIILDSIQTPYVFYATLTNVGLVTAFEARFSIPDYVDGYYFSPLIEGPWDILPHQTITIPVEITKPGEYELSRVRGSRAAQPRAGAACGIQALASFFSKCGGGGGQGLEQMINDAIQIKNSCIQIGHSLSGLYTPHGNGGDPPIGPNSDGNADSGGSPIGGGNNGRPVSVACDPWLQEHGPECIETLIGAANPILSAGMIAASLANGDFVPALLAGTGGVLGAAGTMSGELAALALSAADLANNLGLFKKKHAPTYRGESVAVKQRSGGSMNVIVVPPLDYDVLYPGEIRKVSEIVKSIYMYIVAADKRKHLIDDTPLFFNNDFFTEDAPLPGTISDELPAEFPSWLRVWCNNAQVPISVYYHLLLVYHEVFGDWGFLYLDEEAMLGFLSHYDKWLAEGWTSITVKDLPDMSRFDLFDPARDKLVERISNTLRMRNGEEVESDNYIDYNYIQGCCDYVSEALKAMQRMGYENLYEFYENETEKALAYLLDKRASVCATVKLQIDQSLTMTRQAVRGTLTVNNASENEPMKDIRLNLVVTDQYGNVADSRIMEIHTEEKSGFTGEDDFESGWGLAPKETGVAKILFIPTKYAAPTEPLQYTFSGSISFIDPFSGLEMTRELETERLTVNPSPDLELIYFMQRDIYGDDALTNEVEPVVPAQFSLIINNKGYGDATKVKMSTQQPKIIDNEKGLLVDFEIVSSQLNGGDKTLSMGENIATDFGTIPALSQAYAQWWLTSTLTGHFTEYDVKATHVTSFNNPDLSLLDSVHIHELVHQIEIPLATCTPKLLGFLANDEEDYDDCPDMIYLTNGERYPVYKAAGNIKAGAEENSWELTLSTANNGWCYGNIPDPTVGKQQLLRIVRKSDGAELPLVNFWQTDRTMVDKLEPVYENLLHFSDTLSAPGDSYLLYFSKKSKVLDVTDIAGVPKGNPIVKEAVEVVTVRFNMPIDPATFTVDDIRIQFQGEPADVSKVNITDIGDCWFELDVRELTALDGYYSLTVNTADIIDEAGLPGKNGKMTGWIQVSDGKANFTMECLPEGAGVLTPGTSRQEYEGNVAISAVANAGYRFLYWMCEEGIISEDAETVVPMFGPKNVTAVFQPVQYKVNILYNSGMGTVEGAGSAMFGYNQEVKLKAVPANGYHFLGWRHNGVVIETDPELTFTVKGEDEYEAVFEAVEVVTVFLDENSEDNTSVFEDVKGKLFNITMNRKLSAMQWNTFCVPFDISEQQINKMWGYATMIVQLSDVNNGILHFTSVYNIKAGVPYLVKPERTVTTPHFMYSNDIVVNLEPGVVEFDNVKYAGNYSPYEWSVGDEYYYGVSSNALIKAKETTVPLKGMRGYFTIPQGMKAAIYIDGVVTGISNVTEKATYGESGIYNLQGLYLGKDVNVLAPGIYIINGKKQIVK